MMLDIRIVQALLTTVSWIFLMVAICGISPDETTMKNTSWAHRWTWRLGDETAYANLYGTCSNFGLHCREKYFCPCASWNQIDDEAPKPLFYSARNAFGACIAFLVLGEQCHCHLKASQGQRGTPPHDMRACRRAPPSQASFAGSPTSSAVGT